jgi:hypothetical protein
VEDFDHLGIKTLRFEGVKDELVRNRAECVSEVNGGQEEFLRFSFGIIYEFVQCGDMVSSIAIWGKALLVWVTDTRRLQSFVENGAYNALQAGSDSNWAPVSREIWVTLFVEHYCFRRLPRGRDVTARNDRLNQNTEKDRGALWCEFEYGVGDSIFADRRYHVLLFND